ncbi:MAG: HNH endonuclease [Dehalococcoidia bacterium]
MRPGDIVTHAEMCAEEGGMLQRGMTFRAPPNVGVILMSQRPNAPYQDAADGDGNVLYEGHDAPRSRENPEPKQIDQPRYLPSGKPTENGKFADWTDRFREGSVPPAVFHVYEKVRDGIWTFRGPYALRAYHYVGVGKRKVFRFQLAPIVEHSRILASAGEADNDEAIRRIPTFVKQAVYKRDKGRCVLCGSTSELHFDHELPFSKGGTGLSADNVRILCARCNLSKGARIE